LDDAADSQNASEQPVVRTGPTGAAEYHLTALDPIESPPNKQDDDYE
jgi:hypothetical protein